MDVTNLTIKEVELNNKSRKGLYIYIKEKGKRTAYYKYQEGVSLDDYLNAYMGKLRLKKGGVKGKPTKAQKYIQEFKKTNINKLIDKGINSTIINNFNKLNYNQIHKEYEKMLTPLVKDKTLIRILAQEENIKKYKNRINATIMLSSSNDTIKIGYGCIGKTLNEIKTDITPLLNKTKLSQVDLEAFGKKGYKLVGIPVGIDLTNYDNARMIYKTTDKLTKVQVKLKYIKGR